MQSHPPKWKDIVLVCANQRPADSPKPSCGAQGAAELQRLLKDRLKDEGLWGRVRVVTTGCLDVCTDGGVTCVLDGGQSRVVVGPDDHEALLQQIRDGLR